MAMMQDRGLDPQFDYEPKSRPEEFEPLRCEDNEPGYRRPRWAAGSCTDRAVEEAKECVSSCDDPDADFASEYACVGTCSTEKDGSNPRRIPREQCDTQQYPNGSFAEYWTERTWTERTWTPLYSPARLYEACFKGYLCCTGPDMRCIHGDVRPGEGSRVEAEHCGLCIAEQGPWTLRDGAKRGLADGAVHREDLDTTDDERFGELWRLMNAEEREAFGRTCWQAVTYCNEVCPRDGRQKLHDYCGDCITNFASTRIEYGLPTAEEQTVEEEVQQILAEAAQ
jgi:hypothetical protein